MQYLRKVWCGMVVPWWLCDLSHYEAVFDHKEKADQQRHAKVVFSTRRLAADGNFFLLKGVLRAGEGKPEEAELLEQHAGGFILTAVDPAFTINEDACFAQQVVHHPNIRDSSCANAW